MTKKKQYKYKKSFQTRKKKSIFRNRFFWLSILFLLVLGTVFYFVLFSSLFQIKEIKISGNKKVSTGDIEEVIKNQANKKIIFFANQSIFLIDFKKTNRKLLEKFPQIDEINLKRKFPDIIKADIGERVPVGIWCRGENCFHFDKKGVIFEEGTNEGKLIIKSGIEEPEIFLGEKIFEESYIGTILEIQKSLIGQMGIEIREFIISSDRKKLTAKINQGWEVYFSLKNNISDQLSNLNLVLKEKIPPEERENLDYINLRFGSRIYFRMK